MFGTGKHHVAHPDLPYPPESLHIGMIQQLQRLTFRHAYKTMNRVGKNFVLLIFMQWEVIKRSEKKRWAKIIAGGQKAFHRYRNLFTRLAFGLCAHHPLRYFLSVQGDGIAGR